MRILYHHRTQAEDAQGIHIAEMVNAFRELGHKVEMVSLVESDQGAGGKGESRTWAKIMSFAPDWFYEVMGLGYNVYGFYRLARTARRFKPDLIYERYSLNTFCGVWISRLFRIPIALEVNAPLYYEQQKLGKLTFKSFARFSEKWICSHASLTIVVTAVMKEMLIKEGIPAEKMVVMHNGINPARISKNVSPENVRQKYHLTDSIVIGFVGWFRKWHGLEMLLEAVNNAGLSEKGVKLLLVGDGPAYPDLLRYAQENHMQDSVIFTGPVEKEQIPEYIAAIDIAVQPSATEYACPMKIIEYMGMGKCILAPAQANIQEILDDNISAVFFTPGSTTSLQTALTRLVENAALRKNLADNAYKSLITREMTWKRNARETLKLAFHLVPQLCGGMKTRRSASK